MMIFGLLLLICSPLIVLSDPLPYAEWAHYHMVWLSNDRTDQADIQAMFDGYTNNEIPFGAVIRHGRQILIHLFLIHRNFRLYVKCLMDFVQKINVLSYG